MEGMNVMKKWQKVGMAVVTFIVALDCRTRHASNSIRGRDESV